MCVELITCNMRGTRERPVDEASFIRYGYLTAACERILAYYDGELVCTQTLAPGLLKKVLSGLRDGNKIVDLAIFKTQLQVEVEKAPKVTKLHLVKLGFPERHLEIAKIEEKGQEAALPANMADIPGLASYPVWVVTYDSPQTIEISTPYGILPDLVIGRDGRGFQFSNTYFFDSKGRAFRLQLVIPRKLSDLQRTEAASLLFNPLPGKIHSVCPPNEAKVLGEVFREVKDGKYKPYMPDLSEVGVLAK